MIGRSGRIDIRLAGLIAAGLAIWIAGVIFAGNALLTLPFAAGTPVLAAQVFAQRLGRRAERERDEILPLLEAALPKLKVGLGIDAAFLEAGAETPSEASDAVRRVCRRVQAGAVPASPGEAHGPTLSALLSMITASRAEGGDVVRSFEGFTLMLQADQRLRRKQQLSTLQIRRQANVLVLIAAGILAASLISSQEALVFLLRDDRGRLLVVLSAALFVWGQVALNILSARIGDA